MLNKADGSKISKIGKEHVLTNSCVNIFFQANEIFFYRIVVVLDNRTYIYNFEELRLIDAIETCPN
jgi:hypothetical protein